MALAMKQFVVVAVRLDVAAARMHPASRASRKTENSKVLSSDSREPAFCRNVEFRQSTCREANQAESGESIACSRDWADLKDKAGHGKPCPALYDPRLKQLFSVNGSRGIRRF